MLQESESTGESYTVDQTSALTKRLKKPTEPKPNTTDTQLKLRQQELQRKDEVKYSLEYYRMVKDKLLPIIKNADRNQRQLENTQVEDLKTLLIEAEKQMENTDKEEHTTEKEMQDNNQVAAVDAEISSGDSSDLRLMLLGRAGSEKGVVGNTILDSENSKAGTSITTQEYMLRQGKVKTRKLAVLETPDGFFSSLSQEVIRNCVRLSTPGPHAFLIVIPVNQSIGEERGMLEKMEETFGEMFWRNTIILLTITDEQQENYVEKFRSGNQEVQRLVEKCGNRFHCLNIKENRDGSQVAELLEKIEKMLEENPENFYSSEIYQQIREMEKRVMNVAMRNIQEHIVDDEKYIKEMAEKISNLQKYTNDKNDEDNKCKIEINEMFMHAIKTRNEKRKREQTEMEEIYKQDIKKMKDTYDGEGWIEKKELMKIILTEVHCMLWDLQMQLRRQVELREQMKNIQPDLQNPDTAELSESNSNSEDIHHETVNNPDPEDCKKTTADADEKNPSEEKPADQGPETEGTCSNVLSVQSPPNT
ncbi:uncharacterized protein [Salminus brasiliensis]|uniref:uncharacterized protein n=1 Tax=Salminus brasiliensis TaxID=930266 RepID=UPI003B82D553